MARLLLTEESRKTRLHRLDALLEPLEEINEGGVVRFVPPAVIMDLRANGVKALPTDRPIVLIERVFRAQEPLLVALADDEADSFEAPFTENVSTCSAMELALAS